MTDKEKLEKIKALADKMYTRMAYLTTDTRPIRQAMDEYHQFIINEYHKEEPVSEKECMYSKDNYTDEDRKVLCDGCVKECEFNKKEEPVSEELEEAIEDAMPDANWYIKENNDTTGEDAYNSIQMGNMFKAGAQWQKKRFKKDCADLCNGIATAKGTAVAMAYDKGMADAKEQMMTNAVDVTIAMPYHNGDGGYTQLLDSKEALPFGEKVKVIVIKED